MTQLLSRLVRSALQNRLSAGNTQLAVVAQRGFWGKKDKGGDKKGGNHNKLGDQTKQTLDQTIRLVESVINDLDRTMGATLRDAEKKLGADGFFDKLRDTVSKELKKGHTRIGE